MINIFGLIILVGEKANTINGNKDNYFVDLNLPLEAQIFKKKKKNKSKRKQFPN